MTVGIDGLSGAVLQGFDHVSQSIADILLTPIGTRVMRRDYGSVLPSLIDAPMNETTVADAYAGVAAALDRWEPRFILKRVNVVAAEAGKMEIDLSGVWFFQWPDTQAYREASLSVVVN